MQPTSRDRLQWIDGELAALDSQGLRRTLRTHAGPQQAKLSVAGRELINFGSNDYLGLAADPRLAEAARRTADDEGWGAGASPLITGHGAAHQRLERRLAEFEGTEAALLFSSGYSANMGTICALAGSEDAIYADQKNHASMIDGCRLSRARVHVYPHGDVEALADLLQSSDRFRRRLIVTESVFSMDGDFAPLAQLAELAERFNCMLLVDEAHATGVFGRSGRGLVEQFGLESSVDVRVGTLSKALGCSGGFVAGSQLLIEWLVNRARPYVFSTAMPPAGSAAALTALDIVRHEPCRRETLLDRARGLREQLSDAGWEIGNSSSHIIPLVIGDAETTMQLASRLSNLGLLVPGIRAPAVPSGRSLLRISVSYAHSPEMIAELTTALAAVRAKGLDADAARAIR